MWLSNATVALGAVLPTVTGEDVTGDEFAVPSLAVTRRRIRSPLSPRPATDMSRTAAVAPAMSVPFRVH